MIRVTILKSRDDRYKGFYCEGHALYADAGKDVVCAAVSMLAINTANAIESLAGCDLETASDKESGMLKVLFPEGLNDKGRLLMDAMVLGIDSTEKSYGSRYVTLTEIKDQI